MSLLKPTVKIPNKRLKIYVFLMRVETYKYVTKTINSRGTIVRHNNMVLSFMLILKNTNMLIKLMNNL